MRRTRSEKFKLRFWAIGLLTQRNSSGKMADKEKRSRQKIERRGGKGAASLLLAAPVFFICRSPFAVLRDPLAVLWVASDIFSGWHRPEGRGDTGGALWRSKHRSPGQEPQRDPSETQARQSKPCDPSYSRSPIPLILPFGDPTSTPTFLYFVSSLAGVDNSEHQRDRMRILLVLGELD